MKQEIVSYKEVADALIQSSNAYPVDFNEAWEWIGYARKDAAKRALQDNFLTGNDFLLHRNVEQETKHGGNNKEQIRLTLDCFKAFCMMAGTAKGKEVRAYFIRRDNELREIERQQARALQLPEPVAEVQRYQVIPFLNGIADGLNRSRSLWTTEDVIEVGNTARRLAQAIGVPTKTVAHPELDRVYVWPLEVLNIAVVEMVRRRRIFLQSASLEVPSQEVTSTGGNDR